MNTLTIFIRLQFKDGLALMNKEDKQVANVVDSQLVVIERAVQLVIISFQKVEGAEDDEEQGEKDLQRRNLTQADTVIGVAASGRTPHVIGALAYAIK
ncbi:hypothetical protein V2W34_08100 [Virgibacillus dokdonensis]|uniref:N-acetylmuramic acid 6-phosphate etherase n=1 Tax=Virgibacillus dokdonensis TaxID=302167 RepID=A0A2K9J2L8_9BACI|nr:hypothetical protein [Virgibacillus dokdonensis]AUJ26188.1 N-acetylmuramic acid 6-phosphate etherase [Virgibacillus dokdonensis]